MCRTRFLTVALLVVLAGVAAAEDGFKPDDEGYLRNWLVLAPIPLADGQDGATALGKDQIKDEAKLKPKDGDKATAAGKPLAWKKHQAGEAYVDFNAFLGKETEDSVGYAVCYLKLADDAKGLKLKMGSDDQAKVYLNGKEVLANTTARPLTPDEDTAENITLQKGVNVLVFKVVNEKVDFSGSIRFLDKDGNPFKSFQVRLTP